MGVGFYVELDREVDFETFVEGKPLAWVFEELEVFCKEHNLKAISDYVYDDMSRFELENEFPNKMKEWHPLLEGIEWISKLVATLEKEKPSFLGEYTIETFLLILEVLKKAQMEDPTIQWYFGIDF